MNPIKVLIVAYACEPGKGSEPGIGWDWAVGLADNPGLDVTVLTRANNRPAIEDALSGSSSTGHPKFEYWDLPVWISWWKRGRAAIYPYYVLWCIAIRRKVRSIVRTGGFDLAHHLTFSTDWLPGPFSAGLNCATVIGPLGGYDTADAMRNYVAPRYIRLDRWKKRIRRLGIAMRRGELARCDGIIANNRDFGRHYGTFVPSDRLHYVSTQVSNATQARPDGTAPSGSGIQTIVTAGRVIYWKGHDAVLQALAEYRKRGVEFRAVIVGDGDAQYINALQEKVDALGLEEFLEYRPLMERSAFLKLLANADAFLYPTFYGTADSIMMEAVERRVPVICFPSSGARELLGDDYPHMAEGFSVSELVDRLESADKTSTQNISASDQLVRAHSATRKLAAVAAIYEQSLTRHRAKNNEADRNQ